MKNQYVQPTPTFYQELVASCKDSLVALASFSAGINMLMLVPAFLMLNIYDKALGSNSVETLVVLVLIAFFLFIGLGALEVTRSKILAFVSTRIDKVFAPKCYDIALVNAVATSSSGNEGLILQDLARVRHFLTGSGILAFLD